LRDTDIFCQKRGVGMYRCKVTCKGLWWETGNEWTT